jgi:hypothetical protein
MMEFFSKTVLVLRVWDLLERSARISGELPPLSFPFGGDMHQHPPPSKILLYKHGSLTQSTVQRDVY